MSIEGSYRFKNGKLIKLSKFQIILYRVSRIFHKYKIINTQKYDTIPHSDWKYIFKLSEKEYKDSKMIYLSKGTISYEFYPCEGIGWEVRVKVLGTNEIIDVTDVTNW